MRVGVADTGSRESVLSNHGDNFVILGHIDLPEALQETYYQVEIPQVPHGDLANYMRMNADLIRLNQLRQASIQPVYMIRPNVRVDENQKSSGL